MFQSNKLIVILLILLWVPQSLTAQDRMPEFKDQVVVVQFAPDVMVAHGKTDHSGINRLFTNFEVHSVETVYPILYHVEPTPKTRHNIESLRRTYYVHYGIQEDPLDISHAFSMEKGVVYAEPVLMHQTYHSTAQSTPDDPQYSDQSYLELIHLPEAWDQVKSEDSSVVMAIVDTGGDWDHEDLLANVWTNEDEIAGNGIDDDNNGYIDDIHGINLANGDPLNNDPTPMDIGMEEGDEMNPAGHGTTVAGAAGAVTNNEVGIAGSAWNAKIMHINANCVDEDTCPGYEGILYAAVAGADIINASWGAFAGDTELRMITQTLDLVTDMGSLVIAAIGNNGFNNDRFFTYPDAHPRVLAVGSTTRTGPQLSETTNYGKTVDLYAPGEQILATLPNDQYGRFSGTSLSSPLVSGIAALVKTRFPHLTPDELREQLRLSADNIDAENPLFAENMNGGLVNAEASLTAVNTPAVRLKRWSWEDDDGDQQIDPGDEVTVQVVVINYLSDAQQLAVEMVPVESYPYLQLRETKRTVGALNHDDSTVVEFNISVDESAPANRSAIFSLRFEDGSYTDEPDVLNFRIHPRVDLTYTALNALYTATDGDNWKRNAGWDFTTIPTLSDLSRWHGLMVVEGRLQSIRLFENNLSGVLPPELGQLLGLEELWLQFNQLTGEIPKELSRLTDLKQLILALNQFEGPIPTELGQLTNLESFVADFNMLSGPIPPELGMLTELQWLSLTQNQLTGEIPSELGNLSELNTFDLTNNQLSGQIPPQLGQLTSLARLSLSSNELTGTVPSELGQLVSLLDLDLSGNLLTGSLPRSFINLQGLQSLNIMDQQLCAPADQEFQEWINGLINFIGATCTPVSIERGNQEDTFPEHFLIHGNYPNPFQTDTRLTFDLPWESNIHVEVVDVIGRRVLSVPDHHMSAGWAKTITIHGESLSPGLYLYRLIADSPEERSVQTGTFMKIQP